MNVIDTPARSVASVSLAASAADPEGFAQELGGSFERYGFANFSSIAIQMAVTGGLAPNQRPTIARLGIKALIAGSLANLMSAALAGLLLT